MVITICDLSPQSQWEDYFQWLTSGWFYENGHTYKSFPSFSTYFIGVEEYGGGGIVISLHWCGET